MANTPARKPTYKEVLELARQSHTLPELMGRVLPARGPRGSRQNRLRSTLMPRVLRAWSEIGREGT